MLVMIVGASGLEGSTRKISPSKGFGEKPTPPETIASMIASPIARAVAITVPATRAGRAVRTAIIQKVRQRLMPAASDPSSQLLRTAFRPSLKIAIISGAIITVRITTAADQAVAVQGDDVGDGGLARLGDQVVADERDQHQHADQAVDDRGNARQQPDDRLEDVRASTRARTRR